MCRPAGLATSPTIRRRMAETSFLGKKGYAEYDRVKERMEPTSSTPNTNTTSKKPKQTKIKY